MATRLTSRYLARKRSQIYDKIIRVDHSGEYGADRICFGQYVGLKQRYPQKAAIVQEMWDEERQHLNKFEELMVKYRSSKSRLLPLWNLGAFSMGYLPAVFGYKPAMAVTVAVEKVIVEHYQNQLKELINDDPEIHKELIQILSKFRDDEQHHHDLGIENEAQNMIGYKLLSAMVEAICKQAIKIAEKV